MRTSAFALPARLSAKARPHLIAADDALFSRVSQALETESARLTTRLAELRATPASSGEAAVERDALVRDASAQLSLLGRFDLDLCLGRMVTTTGETIHIGRMGIRDEHGDPLLVDWRTAAAEPYFAATLASPFGLTSRRRYRWRDGVVIDYWDEQLSPDGGADAAVLDDQSAFLAALSAVRSPQMPDVLGTIQADQDAVIRSSSRRPLVVDGGPGTGKTVVALHRAAYLLHSAPQVRSGGGLLFIGPTASYLRYVDDVLPRLGEDAVQMCTLSDLVPETATAPESADSARIKGALDPAEVVDRAVSLFEQPPTDDLSVPTPAGEIPVGLGMWAEAFRAGIGTTPHNDAREEVWDDLVDIIVDHARDLDEDIDEGLTRRMVRCDPALRAALTAAWPVLDPLDIVGDLWTVPAYLDMCAPGLTPTQIDALIRRGPRDWTASDLPFLDAARRRIGDPDALRRRRTDERESAAERARMSDVIDDLISADDSELREMTMLRGADLQTALENSGGRTVPQPDRLAGPFGHIIVDEAQELTDAQWRMILDRCPSKSVTIVGDRAQARDGFAETWEARLSRMGLSVETVHLSVNYRTPAEVMAEAGPVIRAALPDANVPDSVRTSGHPVRRERKEALIPVVEAWLSAHEQGTVGIIAADPSVLPVPDRWRRSERVNAFTPLEVKGLEFDLVVLGDPDRFGDGITGAVDRYVAMTRSTAELVILS